MSEQGRIDTDTILQMGFPSDQVQQALQHANNDPNIAMQNLLEPNNQPNQTIQIGIAPEASRRAAPGPGPLLTVGPEPPAPHRFIARSRELGGSDLLAKIVAAATAGTLVKRHGPWLSFPLLDEAATSHLALLRLICDNASCFSMLLSKDWRRDATEGCRLQLRARETAVRSARIRVQRARSTMVSATIDATITSGRDSAVATAAATRANIILQRHILSLERAEIARHRAAAELKQAELQEQNPAWP